jgi:DNA-binding transcriptional regulator YiaG
MSLKEKRAFVARMKKVREAIPMSIRDFAAALDLSWQTIYRWEKNRANPRPDMMRDVKPKIEELAKRFKVAIAA